MSIEGLPPASNPFSQMDKVESPKQKPQAAEKPIIKEGATPQKPEVKPGVEHIKPAQVEQKPGETVSAGQNTTQVHKGMVEQKDIGDKVARHIAELQALTEKIKRNQQNMQTRQQIASMDQSIVQMRQELNNANSERYGNTLDANATYTKMSYWDKLDVVAKSQSINKIKEQIKNTEIDRAHLVNALKEKINTGSYEASGSEILAGMIDEYF